MWIFPLVAQPTTRSGAVNSLPSTYNMGNTTSDLDQSPLNSPTVFNFFLPDFKFPGTLASQGLTTPEFQDTAETTVVRQSNFILNGLFNPANTNGISSFKGGTNALVLDLSYWMGTPQANPGLSGVAAPQPTQAWTSNANLATLISELSLILNAGQVAASVRGSIRDFLFKPITAMTGSNPVTITSATHKLLTGDSVTINGSTGGTFANGTYTVTVTGANTFTIVTTRTGTQNLTNAFCSPVTYDNAAPSETHRRDRLRSILHLITTSPDYTIQR